MRDSVPSGSYSSVCNVLRQWQSRSSLLIESTDSDTVILERMRYLKNANFAMKIVLALIKLYSHS